MKIKHICLHTIQTIYFSFCSNDYINASKINGGEPMGRQWIVTQGPLNTTIEVLTKLQHMFYFHKENHLFQFHKHPYHHIIA